MKHVTDIVNQKHIRALIRKDKVIGDIYEQYGAPPNWSRPQGFVSLSKIILEQQVSLASANAHFLKLNNYIKEFTPANILKLTDVEMRNCQISRQKAKYLRELSAAILNEKLVFEKLPLAKEVSIREALTAIKGIGTWTSDIYLMFCLGAKDIFPLGDIAVINTIKQLYGVTTREEMLVIAEKWKPNRSLAVYFMWHHYLEKKGLNH